MPLYALSRGVHGFAPELIGSWLALVSVVPALTVVLTIAALDVARHW